MRYYRSQKIFVVILYMFFKSDFELLSHLANVTCRYFYRRDTFVPYTGCNQTSAQYFTENRKT